MDVSLTLYVVVKSASGFSHKCDGCETKAEEDAIIAGFSLSGEWVAVGTVFPVIPLPGDWIAMDAIIPATPLPGEWVASGCHHPWHPFT